MRLLIQPGAGVQPLVEAIDSAKEEVAIAIFRFDRNEVEAALMRAAERGVYVHALIAYTNRGGEKNLRQLEMRLLAKGVTVSRTANDLIRYHGKYVIVDRRKLLLLAFNFTSLDIEQSRSFGLIAEEKRMVAEAVRLFEADSKRQPFEPKFDCFVVSPLNSREQLGAFIRGAEKELLIFDPRVVDPGMVRLLQERIQAGVAVRVIGKVNRKAGLNSRELAPLRLHTRSMIRDGRWVFTGSQSLRTSELESRREVGLIFEDPKIATSLQEVFEADWKASSEAQPPDHVGDPEPAARAAKKLAKALNKCLPEVEPVIDEVREALGDEAKLEIDADQLEESVKKAIRQAVEEVLEGQPG